MAPSCGPASCANAGAERKRNPPAAATDAIKCPRLNRIPIAILPTPAGTIAEILLAATSLASGLVLAQEALDVGQNGIWQRNGIADMVDRRIETAPQHPRQLRLAVR